MREHVDRPLFFLLSLSSFLSTGKRHGDAYIGDYKFYHIEKPPYSPTTTSIPLHPTAPSITFYDAAMITLGGSGQQRCGDDDDDGSLLFCYSQQQERHNEYRA
jgi:hypothetical protein